MTALLCTPTLTETLQAESSAGSWVHVVSHLDPRYGGISAAVPALVSSLIAGGLNMSLAAFCSPGEEAQPAGMTADRLSYWPAGRLDWMKWTSGSLRGRFRDLLSRSAGVHIHGLWEQSTAIAAQTARALGIPYIVSAHGMLEPWALSRKRLKKQLYARLVEHRNVATAACLHALTETEATQYLRFGARSPIAVIPNGVVVPPRLSAELFLEQFPVLRGRRIVLFMARLHAKKGMDLLVDSWAAVNRQSPEAYLVIAGPDSEGLRAGLEERIASSGISSSVLFTGMLDERLKWSALAAAEGFVLPSYSEGLSIGVLEAMGAGVPVIVTEACNMPEVKQLNTGWQIECDIDQLTCALQQLLKNPPSKNSQIGERGAELVRSRYSWSAVSGQMAELYQSARGQSSSGKERRSSINIVYP